MPNLSTNEEAFVEYLRKFHLGESNAVNASRLTAWGSKRQIRLMVNKLRGEAIPICSGNTGYYYAENERELTRTMNYLESHANQVMKAVNGLQSAFRTLTTRDGESE